MGDTIDGPTTRIEFDTTGSPADWLPRHTGRLPRRRLWTAAWCVFLAVTTAFVVYVVYLAHAQKIRADFDYLAAHVGKCFSTPIGAKGLALDATRSEGEIELAFGSGIKETYPLSSLHEVGCEVARTTDMDVVR